MYSVLNTLSEYTYFYISKIITSCTFLLVFKIVESLQCILEKQIFSNSCQKKIKCLVAKHLNVQIEQTRILYNNISYNNTNIIIITYYYFCNIIKIRTYLMPEAYSKPWQISKIMRYIENSGIVRIVYSGIFKHIQGHSAIFSHVQAY